MRRNLYKITHNQNLHVGVNKINFSGRRHDTVSRHQSLHGFTLIELLVVIAVIALLMSVFLPGLQKAKRQARVMVCATNLRSYAMGFSLAAENNNGKYPKRVTPQPILIYYPNTEDTMEKNSGNYSRTREVLEALYVTLGDNPKSYYCPLAPENWIPTGEPGYFDERDGIKKYCLVWRGRDIAPFYYSDSYNMYAGLDYEDVLPGAIDWSRSGNGLGDNKGPVLSGNSRVVVAADRNSIYRNHGKWEAGHNRKGQQYDQSFINRDPFVEPYPEIFIDSNKAFGDGHVERTRKIEDLRWIKLDLGSADYFYQF